MVWVTATGWSLLTFVSSGVKINTHQYISDILEVQQHLWANEHLQDVRWALLQDLVPSHSFKQTQHWIQENIPSFIGNFNPLDFFSV